MHALRVSSSTHKSVLDVLRAPPLQAEEPFTRPGQDLLDLQGGVFDVRGLCVLHGELSPDEQKKSPLLLKVSGGGVVALFASCLCVWL